jgi:hypothetical protein
MRDIEFPPIVESVGKRTLQPSLLESKTGSEQVFKGRRRVNEPVSFTDPVS